MRMFIRMAVVEALKPFVGGTVDEVEGAFVCDWATNWVRSATVALPVSDRGVLYVSMIKAKTTA